MSLEDFTKTELVQILELIETAGSCSGAKDLQKLILTARDLVEADFAICGLLKAGVPEIILHVNGNYPDEWIGRYMSEKFYLTDPVVRYISNYAHTQLWTDIFSAYKDDLSKKLIRDAGDFKINHGITSGIYIPELDNIAVFTFSGDKNRFTQRHRTIVDILMLHFNKALLRNIGITPGRRLAEGLPVSIAS